MEDLQPDIAIVSECESPQKLWGKQPLLAPIPMEWVGDNENKGLGVLAFNIPLDWCSRLREIEVGAFDAWVGKGMSDHVPLIVEVDVQVRQVGKSSKPDKTIRTDLEG